MQKSGGAPAGPTGTMSSGQVGAAVPLSPVSPPLSAVPVWPESEAVAPVCSPVSEPVPAVQANSAVVSQGRGPTMGASYGIGGGLPASRAGPSLHPRRHLEVPVIRSFLLTCAVAVGLSACDSGSSDNAGTTPAPEAPGLKTDVGVDAANKVVRVGVLNDESGPAAPIGKPYALGKRILVAQVNAGGSGILPDGWTVELVDRDHGYNPQNSVQAFNEIKDRVLYFGTSFGTPNTLPLVPMLERDGIVAFPASLSSKMAENAHTPPVGPSYAIESRRAMDWVVEAAGGAEHVKAGIVYQQDDYGGDGLAGWKQAAEQHGVTLVSEQTVAPGQKDFAAVVTALKDAGATHVLMTTLPSATGPILGTAAQLQYMPNWVGNTPAWIDSFFNPEVIPPVVFTNYSWVQGLPFWGETVTGMDAFTAAWEAHRSEGDAQNTYVLMSYVQGLIQLEALSRAIESGDATRAGYMAALQGISGFDAGGLIQPVDLTSVPYTTGTRTRILKPDFAAGSWTVVADYADPKAPAAAE